MTWSRFSEISQLAAAIILCQGVGYIGSLFTRPAIPGWYAGLARPALTPPGWVFAPVWITLYLLMGVALYLVWRQGLSTSGVKPALLAFGVQLALNALWSWLFFGMRSPLAGLVDIVLLWLAIIVCMVLFLRVSAAAFGLLVPYILWVSFAAWLNYGILVLNR